MVLGENISVSELLEAYYQERKARELAEERLKTLEGLDTDEALPPLDGPALKGGWSHYYRYQDGHEDGKESYTSLVDAWSAGMHVLKAMGGSVMVEIYDPKGVHVKTMTCQDLDAHRVLEKSLSLRKGG